MSGEYKPLLSTPTGSSVPSDEEKSVEQPKIYKKRWLVLSVFFFHLLYANLAWSNMDSIADLARCYYNVNLFWINSLAYVYSIVYVVAFIFATWFLSKFGLQWAAILAGSLGAAGGWIKFAAVGNNYFFLLLFGQTFIAVQNVIEWSAPALLSAVWFPPHERAVATALVGAVAPQTGVLISLSLGPIVFINLKPSTICEENSNSFAVDLKIDMYSRLFYCLLGQAVFATLLLPVTFMIPKAPPTPPSVSKQIENNMEKLTARQSVALIAKNVHFIFFLLVFGILLSANAVYVIAFEEVLYHSGYGQYEKDMTYIGLAMQILSIVGLLVVGKWIDYTKTFYGSAVVLCLLSTIIASAYALVVQLNLNFYTVSVMCTLTVVFVTIFQAVGYEFGVEMTFPVEEGTVVALLNAVSRALVILMIMVASAVMKKYAGYVLWLLAGALGLAFVIQIFVRPKLKREELDSQYHKKRTYGKPRTDIQ